MFTSFPYFAPKLFCFFIIRLLVCIGAFTPDFLVEFFWFKNVPFCLYCFILSRYLFSFLLVSVSGLLPRVVSFVLIVVFLFSFRSNLFQCSSSVLLFSFVVDFLLVFLVEFPIRVLSFCSCFLRNTDFFRRLLSPLYRLVHLIPWFCSFRYVLIIRLFFSFLQWLLSFLCFLSMVIFIPCEFFTPF